MRRASEHCIWARPYCSSICERFFMPFSIFLDFCWHRETRHLWKLLLSENIDHFAVHNGRNNRKRKENSCVKRFSLTFAFVFIHKLLFPARSSVVKSRIYISLDLNVWIIFLFVFFFAVHNIIKEKPVAHFGDDIQFRKSWI